MRRSMPRGHPEEIPDSLLRLLSRVQDRKFASEMEAMIERCIATYIACELLDELEVMLLDTERELLLEIHHQEDRQRQLESDGRRTVWILAIQIVVPATVAILCAVGPYLLS